MNITKYYSVNGAPVQVGIEYFRGKEGDPRTLKNGMIVGPVSNWFVYDQVFPTRGQHFEVPAEVELEEIALEKFDPSNVVSRAEGQVSYREVTRTAPGEAGTQVAEVTTKTYDVYESYQDLVDKFGGIHTDENGNQLPYIVAPDGIREAPKRNADYSLANEFVDQPRFKDPDTWPLRDGVEEITREQYDKMSSATTK